MREADACRHALLMDGLAPCVGHMNDCDDLVQIHLDVYLRSMLGSHHRFIKAARPVFAGMTAQTTR